jgi:hypothetical protein
MRRAAILSLLTVVTIAGGAMAATPPRPVGAPATCRHQSSAGFPKSARDLVVGPLVLIGARAYSPPNVIRTFGGQKYPAVLLAGHRVTVELSRTARRASSLLYADDHWHIPDGERTVGDGHRVVEFRSCPGHRAASSYDGRKATFWSGFVLTSAPRCLTLRVWVDDGRTPRRAHLPLGKRCA